MPLYFGLPVTLEEACRILDIGFDESIDNYYEIYLKVNKFLEKDLSSDIRVYSTDKGQYVVGYKIKETDDVWDEFCSADKLIMMLVNLKAKFAKEMTRLEADLSEVTLEYMEGEPKIVFNPEPFVMSWHG